MYIVHLSLDIKSIVPVFSLVGQLKSLTLYLILGIGKGLVNSIGGSRPQAVELISMHSHA